MSHYQYTLSFPLADGCPTAVTNFFEQLALGATPEELPESDERQLETSAADVVGLLAGNVQLRENQVTLVGTASAEAFYMPFIALCEWLAQWSAERGPVGYYHRQGLENPTLLYFSGGVPYMLQATGTPTALASGEAMPEPAAEADES